MPVFFAMPGNQDLAESLAALTGGEASAVETRHFPDGETYVRLHRNPGEDAFLVCTLARPDEQFLPLMFAARTLREHGAGRLTLIAPYLSYLRQDRAFKAGEAVTSRVFAELIGREFDRLVTVDPHLHRIHKLEDVYSIPACLVHSSALIGRWVREHVASPVIFGPDAESAQWVEEIAAEAGCGWAVFRKERRGDRDVRLAPPPFEPYLHCTPVLADDIIASGATMIEAARLLVAAGMRRPHCLAVHALFDESTAAELARVSTAIATSDSIPSAFSAFALAPLIAEALSAAA